jgi:hypothetical protein
LHIWHATFTQQLAFIFILNHQLVKEFQRHLEAVAQLTKTVTAVEYLMKLNFPLSFNVPFLFYFALCEM